ncbi:ethanolamine ammonia-lyase subunit EutC [Sporomusa acidovorans]|uniref:Ethanolamine ammonia-lyase small subunit n=1 Tax=Sporomusa acidovorans (strain ATCC 49682 / DSM 3132 / Mol) TaxID=1123286 RepID=A0ABZ3J7B5_SPOA4|nr:ethanolamine ammonia-lyase subunit EutC [Sporomusa acidovorans]OZC21234.1 ethanolamine ammonia-lyase light chain [Sporomusa acidovorans DSM 3132]SDE65567.1 Ethanolamine ammonia-lyase light chain [Sporomusa acidovorans]
MAVAASELEKIIQEVLNELGKNGGNKKAVTEHAMSAVQAARPAVGAFTEKMVSLIAADEILVEHPVNLAAIKAMKKATTARIGIGRAGARPKTASWLKLLADHAVAQDAVFVEVSEDFLQRTNLFSVQSAAENKEQFLTRPDLGRRLSDEAVQTIRQKCEKDMQVQILIVDGLSSTAIEANVPDILPALQQGLKANGIKVGTPFFIKHGRVGVQDEVGQLLNAELVISLIGERPGLGTAESLSAYIIYRPNEKTVEADRNVVSNIYKGGIPPAEAGAHLVDLIRQILSAKASGVRFK